MRAARGTDGDWRVRGAATEGVEAVGRESKRAGVAIGANFDAGFEGVLAAGEGDGLTGLIQVGPVSDDISGRQVERLVEAVGEIDAGLGRVLGAENRGAAFVAERRFENQIRREGAGVD